MNGGGVSNSGKVSSNICRIKLLALNGLKNAGSTYTAAATKTMLLETNTSCYSSISMFKMHQKSSKVNNCKITLLPLPSLVSSYPH